MLKGIREAMERGLLSLNHAYNGADNFAVIEKYKLEQALKDIEAIEREYVMIKISDVPDLDELGCDLTDTEADKHFKINAADWSIYLAATLLHTAIKEHGGKNEQ